MQNAEPTTGEFSVRYPLKELGGLSARPQLNAPQFIRKDLTAIVRGLHSLVHYHHKIP